MKSLRSILLIALASLALQVQAQTRKDVLKLDSFSRISFRVSGKLLLRQGTTQKVEIEGDKDYLKELDIRVDGDRLIIGREGSWKDWGWNSDNNERVTVYVTIPDLEALNVSGSGDLVAETKFKVANLDLDVSGSGSLQIEADASGDIDADVSGSGRIELTGNCQNFESHISGSGRIRMNEKIARTAAFGVSGSGKIEASGTSAEVKTSISGSGKVLAANLETDKCDIRISGSGDVEINVKSELDAHISGSGSVSYKGDPSHVNSHSSGAGHVRKL